MADGVGVDAWRDRFVAALDVAKAILGVVTERNLTFIAGSIAYSAFLSLVPLLVLLFAITTLLRGEGVASLVLTGVGRYLTPTAEALLRDALGRRNGVFGASLVGFVVLAWSSLKVFRGLNVAFAAVYGEMDTSFVGTVRDGLTALTCLVVAVGALVAIEGALTLFVDRLILELLGPVLLLATVSTLLFPIYYVLPDVPVTAREVVPGTVFTAAGWLGLGAGFRVYVALVGGVAGALGAVVLLLTWLYVAALLLLVGGALNAVLGGKERRRPTAELTEIDET